LGDVREIAVTEANFAQLLFQQGEYPRALSMAWHAYTRLHERKYTRDAQIMQRMLVSMKEEDTSRFDTLWEKSINERQPNWLRNVQAAAPARISTRELGAIVANTVTVMTEMPEKRAEWRETLTEALQKTRESNRVHEAEFFTALLALLDGQTPALPADHPYAKELAEIESGIAAGGLPSVSTDSADSLNISDEVLQAVRDFVNAESWQVSRQVLEQRQEILFQPEVEVLFERNIAGARAAGDQRAIEMLETHLNLLRGCKKDGVAATFEQFMQARQLPFDAELVSRSIAALLEGPQGRMAHAQYLNTLAAQTTDEELKKLINAIQMALFGGALSQPGQNLSGVYLQAWQAIVVGVETGGVDPEVFEQLVRNTRAVLGPAADKRSEWRNTLVDVRNQATLQGDQRMVALLDAIIGLLDADGNPTGLGVGLTGLYAQTWQGIVQEV